MNKWWLVLVALWKIGAWWFKRGEEIKAKRQALIKEVDNAIEKDDYRSLHRIMSRL